MVNVSEGTEPRTGTPGGSLSSKVVRADLCWIAQLGLAVRACMWLVYQPWWSGDSPWYTSVWFVLSHRQWHEYDGTRTPGYPALLGFAQWVTGFQPHVVLAPPTATMLVLIQQALGAFASILVYLTLLNLGCNRKTAFAAGLFLATYMGTAVIEMILLPIALTSSLIAIAIWAASQAFFAPKERTTRGKWAALAGLASAAACLTRPETTVFLGIFWLVLIIGTRQQPGTKRIAGLVALWCLPWLAVWTCFNGVNLGQYSLSTLTGFNETSAVYNLWNSAPPADAKVAHIMTKYFKGPSRPDMVCDAWPELLASAGTLPLTHRRPYSTNSDLNAYLGKVSLELAFAHPKAWTRNALASLAETFHFDLYPAPVNRATDPRTVDFKPVVQWPLGQTTLFNLLKVQALAMLCLYLALWTVAIRALVPWKSALDLPRSMAAAMAWGILGTYVAFGLLSHYFRHYGVEFYPVFVVTGAWYLETPFGPRRVRHQIQIS